MVPGGSGWFRLVPGGFRVLHTPDLHCLFEWSSLIVVGFLVLNLLPRFLEWLLILKLKF